MQIKDKVSVFFSAPATSDQGERDLYRQIINELESLGCRITYDWLNDKEDYDPKSTTRKSFRAIEISDILVAENSTSSTGVGSQVALAQSKKIPVIILTRNNIDTKGSFFSFSGFSQEISIYKYNVSTLHQIITKAIEKVAHDRFVKFNFISTPIINQALEREANKRHVSKSAYLRQLLTESLKL